KPDHVGRRLAEQSERVAPVSIAAHGIARPRDRIAIGDLLMSIQHERIKSPADQLRWLLPRRKMREAHQELSQFVLRLELSENDLGVYPSAFEFILYAHTGKRRSRARRTEDQREGRGGAVLGSGALDRLRYRRNMRFELGLAKIAHPSRTDHNAHAPLAFVEVAERHTLWCRPSRAMNSRNSVKEGLTAVPISPRSERDRIPQQVRRSDGERREPLLLALAPGHRARYFFPSKASRCFSNSASFASITA